VSISDYKEVAFASKDKEKYLEMVGLLENENKKRMGR
jgi:hypothetical protein